MWQKKSMFLHKKKKILDVELWAIVEELGTAKQKITAVDNIFIIIFSDSHKALIAF